MLTEDQKFKGNLRDSRKAIEMFNRLKNDGRIRVINHRKDPNDGNFYVDLAFEHIKNCKTEFTVYADKVMLCDWFDVGEALFHAYKDHPLSTRKGEPPSFYLRKNTLNKLKTFTIAERTKENWVRFPFKFAEALLASEYVKVNYSKREAENTTFQYCDYFEISIVDPDEE